MAQHTPRAKNFKSVRKFYKLHYGLGPPYKILLERNFLLLSIENGLDIANALNREFKSFVTLYCLDCIKNPKDTNFLEAFEKYPYKHTIRYQPCMCLHKRHDPAQCIIDFVSSNAGYCVAMRQLGRAKEVRAIPGVPILYNLPRTSKIFIEKPSAMALSEVKQTVEQAKVQGLDRIKPAIEKANDEIFKAPEREKAKKEDITLQYLYRQSKEFKKEKKRSKFDRKKIKTKEKAVEKISNDIKEVQLARRKLQQKAQMQDLIGDSTGDDEAKESVDEERARKESHKKTIRMRNKLLTKEERSTIRELKVREKDLFRRKKELLQTMDELTEKKKGKKSDHSTNETSSKKDGSTLERRKRLRVTESPKMSDMAMIIDKPKLRLTDSPVAIAVPKPLKSDITSSSPLIANSSFLLPVSPNTNVMEKTSNIGNSNSFVSDYKLDYSSDDDGKPAKKKNRPRKRKPKKNKLAADSSLGD